MMAKITPTDYYQTGSLGEGTTRFAITGVEETLDLFRQLQEEIGDSKKTSKILVDAVKQAMKPVLDAAKRLAPKGDTHLLSNSLSIVGRRPTGRDQRSKYINANDTVIAIVTTKSIKKQKKKYLQQNAGILSDYANSEKGSDWRKITYKKARSARRKFYLGMGIPYDGRAAANEFGTKTEFGTAHTPASPFMRPAMEWKGKEAAESLGKILKEKIEKYRSKNAK